MKNLILSQLLWLTLVTFVWADDNPESPAVTNASVGSNTTNLLSSGDVIVPGPNLDVYLQEANKELDASNLVEGEKEQNSKLNDLDAAFDKTLPPDVLAAIRFIQENISRGDHVIVLSDKGLLVSKLFGTVYVASLKDLSPDDMTIGSNDLGTKLSLYTTGRTPLVTISDSPQKVNCAATSAIDESHAQRIANAFADIIRFYGGKSEVSLSGAKTTTDLLDFIQVKLSKALRDKLPNAPARAVTVTFDDKTGVIQVSYPGYPEYQTHIS